MSPTLESHLIAKLSAEGWRRVVRRHVRDLYNDRIDRRTFLEHMILSMGTYFSRAFVAGIAECGFARDEMTNEWLTELNHFVNSQSLYVPNFASAIEERRIAADEAEAAEEPDTKVRKRGLQILYNRAGMWANRYQEAFNLAKTISCADRKLKWNLGPTEHCEDCARLAGKVKRASIWRDADIRPQMPRLACSGRWCQCSLDPTDEHGTPGRLPMIG